MGLITAFANFLCRAFRNGALAIFILSLFYISTYICSQFNHITIYTTALRDRSITLTDLPADYVRSLNESINQNVPFTHNITTNTFQIPRIIHQTYKTITIPEKWEYSYNSCKEQNPAYTHMFWTDESARQFIESHFPWFLSTYDAYLYPIQRVDSIRYFLLWHYGGIYIDLDVSCRRPLDPLLTFPAWFPKTQPYGVSNDIIASTARHPVMLKLALSLHDHNERLGTGYTTVFWSTGPMFVNVILGKWFKAVENGDGNDGVRILPPMFYDRTGYSFFGHREGSSWHGGDVAFAKWAYGRLWWLLGLVTLGPAVLMFVCRRRWESKQLYYSRV
ncbi:hypothetical protein IFR04_006509 [Cadophora malorum]|uniref:Glycosyltransferase family 32 protein n=1 Tax=Cadophora malorum TaxID=108018 RepID=A0A8H7TIV6_9HELO|nr:hypothetical protein IFR04_006509 [Cadophora malorum]